MSTIDKIAELLKESGKSQKDLTDYLGITKNAFTDWKSGRIKSYVKYLSQIAEFFGVSVDYLLGNETREKPIESNVVFLENKTIYMIPLYESVSAGFGAYASDYIVDYVPCYVASKAEADESLCIVVSGDSMYPKIESGDTIQVHKQSSVDSGAIAVVLVDKTEALVKRVIYGNDWIELHSINPMYPPQRFEGKDVLRIEVVGLVKKVIKDV